jgi:hypothetical protein
MLLGGRFWGRWFCCTDLWVRSAWIDTTAGVSRSAMDVNALLSSTTDAGAVIGAVVPAVGVVRDCWAKLDCVRSRPDASRSPPANAPTRAPPNFSRFMECDVIVLACSCSGWKPTRPCAAGPERPPAQGHRYKRSHPGGFPGFPGTPSGAVPDGATPCPPAARRG